MALVGGWLLAQSRQPARYDAARDTLSALAAHGAVDRWIMTSSFVVMGGCHVVMAVGARGLGSLPRVVWAVGGLATLGVAAAPQPSPAHAPAATVAFVALAVWPALARGARRVGVPATLASAVLLVWFFVELQADGNLVGASERAVAAAEALAPALVLLLARRPDLAAGGV